MEILEKLRNRIDEVDNKLIELLNYRMDLCRKVYKEKYYNSLEVLDRSREEFILEKIKKKSFYDISSIYNEILSTSKLIQDKKINLKCEKFYNDLKFQHTSSKSYLQRLLAIAFVLQRKEFVITNVRNISDDCISLINFMKQCGFSFDIDSNSIKINCSKFNIPREVSFNESGLATRMMSVIISIISNKSNKTYLLKGKKTLLNRDFSDIVDVITILGGNVGYSIKMKNDDKKYLPIYISNDSDMLDHYDISEIDSSQTITGLLIGLGLTKNNISLSIEKPTSISYINMTLNILKKLGINVESSLESNILNIKMSNNLIDEKIKIECENDWSSLAYVFSLYATNKQNIPLTDLPLDSVQGDKVILDILQQMGYVNNKIALSAPNEYYGFSIDITHTPDVFPAISILALICKNSSRIYGIKRLINKECNRLQAIINILDDIGATYILSENEIIINPFKVINNEIFKDGYYITTFGDHRISMAAFILSTILHKDNIVKIDDCLCINKSFPTFVDDFITNKI